MRTEKITQRNWVLPFCKDSTEKRLELVCFYNECPQNAVIEIENTVLRCGIPAFGYRYFVLAENDFVIAFDAIYPADRSGRDILFTGRDYPWGYKFRDGEWFYRIDRQRYEFCSGLIRMSTDGRSWIDGYPGPELVYLKNEVGIFADGKLYARHAYNAPAGLRFIQGCQDGEFCITSDRKIYKTTSRRRRSPAVKLRAQAVDIRIFPYGYVVMGAQGEVFFSSNGQKWKREADLTATAIAAGGNYVVAAKPGGTLAIYQYEDETDSLTFYEEIQTPAEHISDLAVVNDLIGWESADCTFEFLKPDKNGMYRSVR